MATTIRIPAGLRHQLDLVLFSELEGRVPKSAYQRFLVDRLQEFFGSQLLDLAPFLGSQPGEHRVRGQAATIEALRRLLERNPRG